MNVICTLKCSTCLYSIHHKTVFSWWKVGIGLSWWTLPAQSLGNWWTPHVAPGLNWSTKSVQSYVSTDCFLHPSKTAFPLFVCLSSSYDINWPTPSHLKVYRSFYEEKIKSFSKLNGANFATSLSITPNLARR